MMMSSGSDLLSARASVIWIAALSAVLVFHCSHLIHMRGERRCYHSAHVVMLLGMLYMYAAVAFGLDWFPTRVWMIIYVATSAAIISWMLVQFGQRRSFDSLRILALVQQGAMIYMWAPMTYWVPAYLRLCRVLRARNDRVADEGVYQARARQRCCGGRPINGHTSRS
jgi:hypothetical protein